MSDKRKLEKTLTIRLAPEIYNNIIEKAKKDDVTAATILRRLVFDSFANEEERAELKTDIKAYKERKPFNPDIEQIRLLRESTAELCGSLVQFAIRCRTDNLQQTYEEVESLIPEVRQTVRNIDALRKDMEA